MVNRNRNTESSLEAQNNGQTNVFDPNTNVFANDIFSDFDSDWDDCDPLTAPLLTGSSQTKREQSLAAVEAAKRRELEQSQILENLNESVKVSDPSNDIFDRFAAVEHLLDLVNRAALPFHHLIPAALLTPATDLTKAGRAVYQSRPAHSAARQQQFWQSLAARGVSAKEAALLDDSLACRYLEFGGNDNRVIEVDWEVLHRDPLEGCAELYLAEMFLCKCPIYQAGDDLHAALELNNDNLGQHLPEGIFAPLVSGSIGGLFFDGLSASSTLTISANRKNPSDSGELREDKSGVFGKAVKSRKITVASDYFDRYVTTVFSRIEKWLSRSNGENENSKDGKRIYRLRLGDYWLDWQRAARLARFDFDYLQTVPDARAVRFYELTKLWRTASAPLTKDGKPPLRLEIEYERFAALLPLPLMTSEREIIRQIDKLIEPLGKRGYVKSFAVKADWRGGSARASRLVFRFDD